LRGLVVATVTPLREDGALDLPSLGGHIRDLVQAGAEGLFVAGTTGEGLLLEEDERVAVVEAVAREVATRLDAPMAGLPPIAGYKAALTRRGVIASAAVPGRIWHPSA
jgi:dihydrodipicolinate synthase/N-acetylneuraminate lyase